MTEDQAFVFFWTYVATHCSLAVIACAYLLKEMHKLKKQIKKHDK